jgi:hypothetical protein
MCKIYNLKPNFVKIWIKETDKRCQKKFVSFLIQMLTNLGLKLYWETIIDIFVFNQTQQYFII